jgi:trimeric autotransporter adhesin
VRGENFTPDAKLFFGDAPVSDFTIVSRKKIRFRTPKQEAPGGRTLTVQTGEGVAQCKLSVISKPLSELAPGEITTVAGGIPYIGDGGRAVDTPFFFYFYTSNMVADNEGNLFFADNENYRIRRIDVRTGIINTIAGNGGDPFAGKKESAALAEFEHPCAISVDNNGNIFFLDFEDNRVRRIDARTGAITVIVGNGGKQLDDTEGVPAVNVSIKARTIFADAEGNLFFKDRVLRRVDGRTGIITSIFGKATEQPAFPFSEYIALDQYGNIYLISSSRVFRLDLSSKSLSVVAGNGNDESSKDGDLAVKTALNPTKVAVDGKGNLFILEHKSKRVRRVDARTGIINTVAGTGENASYGDGGPGTTAGLYLPWHIIADDEGNLFIIEHYKIRRVDAHTGIITTVAGSGDRNYSGDGGPAFKAGLAGPSSLAIDGGGNIYFAHRWDRSIRVVKGVAKGRAKR